ncbi:hemerythrin domain-containing protein [Streptomyces sp. NPDC026673]|uniref:hemerythrin domain-containing protein n=1 Tax=Streptomyces sp. NPDC026673 TaxID=3155724 RepID=UPI0033E0F95F
MSTDHAVPMANVKEMYVVHTMFRREFGLTPGLVRGVAEGDLARTRIVAEHIDIMLAALTSHHEGEDIGLWPRLLERVSAELAPLVHVMEEQHEQLHAACDDLAEAVRSWRATGSAARGEEVAAIADRLNRIAFEHMRLEEETILPLAAQHVTAAEWAELGGHGISVTPKDRLALQFGMTLYEGDPEVMKGLLKGAPLRVRVLMPMKCRRRYRAYARRLHGTATPPRAEAPAGRRHG